MQTLYPHQFFLIAVLPIICTQYPLCLLSEFNIVSQWFLPSGVTWDCAHFLWYLAFAWRVQCAHTYFSQKYLVLQHGMQLCETGLCVACLWPMGVLFNLLYHACLYVPHPWVFCFTSCVRQTCTCLTYRCSVWWTRECPTHKCAVLLGVPAKLVWVSLTCSVSSFVPGV